MLPLPGLLWVVCGWHFDKAGPRGVASTSRSLRDTLE